MQVNNTLVYGGCQARFQIFDDWEKIFWMRGGVKEPFDHAEPIVALAAQEAANRPAHHCLLYVRPRVGLDAGVLDANDIALLIMRLCTPLQSYRNHIRIGNTSVRNFEMEMVYTEVSVRVEGSAADFAEIVLLDGALVSLGKGDPVLTLKSKVFGVVSFFNCWDLFCSRHFARSVSRSF